MESCATARYRYLDVTASSLDMEGPCVWLSCGQIEPNGRRLKRFSPLKCRPVLINTLKLKSRSRVDLQVMKACQSVRLSFQGLIGNAHLYCIMLLCPAECWVIEVIGLWHRVRIHSVLQLPAVVGPRAENCTNFAPSSLKSNNVVYKQRVSRLLIKLGAAQYKVVGDYLAAECSRDSIWRGRG